MLLLLQGPGYVSQLFHSFFARGFQALAIPNATSETWTTFHVATSTSRHILPSHSKSHPHPYSNFHPHRDHTLTSIHQQPLSPPSKLSSPSSTPHTHPSLLTLLYLHHIYININYYFDCPVYRDISYTFMCALRTNFEQNAYLRARGASNLWVWCVCDGLRPLMSSIYYMSCLKCICPCGAVA